MEIIHIIDIALTVIGAATVALKVIAPMTKTLKDDKVLNFLKKLLAMVSLNVDDKTLNIDNNYANLTIKVKK